MKEIFEENKLNITILKKLLNYLKPYVIFVIISVILLLVITFLELLQTVIIGKAIDNYINGYKKPLVIIEKEKKNSIKFKNLILSYDEVDLKNKNLRKAQIIYFNNKYYFFMNLSDLELEKLNKADSLLFKIKTIDEIELKIDDKIIIGNLLKKDDLKILRKRDYYALIYFFILFLFLVIVIFLFTYLEAIINQYTGQKVIFNIRRDLFNHILNLSFNFFDKNPIGRIVTRITNDTENINEMYTEVLANFFKNIFLIIGIIIMMLIINFKLALISFSVLPLVYLVIMIYRSFALKNYRLLKKLLADLNTFLSEKISGIKIIKILNLEEKMFKKFSEISKATYKGHLTEIVIFAIFRPSMFLLYIIAVIVVMISGGIGVIKSTISIGTLFIFLQYVSRLFDPIEEFAEQFNIFQSGMVSAERIFNLFDEKNEIYSPEKPIFLNKIKGNIKFDNVWFSYDNKEWVLQGVSFEVKEGQTVAIVGSTGAGKTSIFNLLCRYYEFQKGKITIDGIDIREIDAKSLRRRIGVVLQDVFIFTGTIMDNIRLKDKSITEKDVIEAVNFVNANDIIEKLPGKYMHLLSEKGATLSQGERQLLSFARAIAKNPDMFLLDEATSNIDTETEEKIQKALEKMLKGKTSLVIAHRLSTIKNADKIIVLHHGRIVEEGTHKELLRKRGFYYRLYYIQFKEN